MKFSRLLLVAAAAGAAYYYKGRGTGALASVGPRLRLALGGGMGAATPAASPVAETMWTPSDPAPATASTGSSSNGAAAPA